jgi:rubrerythrin
MSSNDVEIIELKRTISELELVHNKHILELKKLHNSRESSLESEVASWREKCQILSEEKQNLDGLVDGMRVEVEMLRQSFDLVQGRLKKVLVNQDDLVRLVQLFDIQQQQLSPQPQQQQQQQQQLSPQQNRTNYSSKSRTSTTTSVLGLDELEEQLKVSQNESKDSSSTAAMLQSIKYLRKIEASDPVHLCRLLDISFCPDRSFSLSNSLLSSISLHMSMEDSLAIKSFKEFPIYSILLNEIVRLHQDINSLCRIIFTHHSRNKNGKNSFYAEFGRKLLDKTEKGSVAKWLLELTEMIGGDNQKVESLSFSSSILSSFISKFK